MASSISKTRYEVWLNIALFVCLCTIWLAIAVNYRGTAWDFTQFFVVAHVPVAQVYDQQILHERGQELLRPLGIDYYPPYVRPAVGVVPIRPLQFFSYWKAFWLFASIQFAACIAILWISIRYLHVRTGIAAGVAFFYPAMMGIVTGQDILLVTLIAIVGFVILKSDHPLEGGLVLGLTAYKYNLFLFIPLFLVARRCWRGFTGWATTAGALALISILLAPPARYLELLRSIDKYTIGFSPATMISVRGPLAAAGIPVYPVLAFAIAGAAVFAFGRGPIEQAFYTGQVASVLAGYHVTWYDATVLLVPLAWLVAPAQSLPRAPGVRLGRVAAGILLLGTPLWPFGGVVMTLLMAIVFITLCLMQYQRVDGSSSSISRRLACPSASASRS